jgi:hypothetical protein
MTSDPGILYAEREKRFNDIVALRKPDRIPIVPLVLTYFPTRWLGISNRDAGYDDVLRYESAKKAVLEFGWDFGATNGIFPSSALEAIGCTQYAWPGGALADDCPYQYVEREYVREDEYDELLADPNHFVTGTLIPRIAPGLAGVGAPLPPAHWFACTPLLIGMLGNIVATPPIRAALESLIGLADATSAHNAALGAHIQEMAALGYPFGWVGIAVPAFDLVSDFFRGLKGGSLDLYRQPDKLLAAVELMEPVTIAGTIQAAKMSGNPRVFIAMHRGADNFMSEADFQKYYWPSFKRQIEAFVAAGLTPMPLFEGGYSSRLKYLAELPAGKVAAHFDVVDRRKFKEICGEVLCFWWNIPSSILCTGTPQQVRDEVKELVDLFGDTGALMIDGSVGIPDEARPENLYALREAVDEYGKL